MTDGQNDSDAAVAAMLDMTDEQLLQAHEDMLALRAVEIINQALADYGGKPSVAIDGVPHLMTEFIERDKIRPMVAWARRLAVMKMRDLVAGKLTRIPSIRTDDDVVRCLLLGDLAT